MRQISVVLAVAVVLQAPGSAFAQVAAVAAPRLGVSLPAAAVPLAAAPLAAPLSALAPAVLSLPPALSAPAAFAVPSVAAAAEAAASAPAALPAAAAAVAAAAVAASPAAVAAAPAAAAPGSARAAVVSAAAPLTRPGVDVAAHLGRVFDASAAAAPGDAAPVVPAGAQTPAQTVMLRTLKQIASLFTEHYAPIEWKQSRLHVNFQAEYEKVRAAVLADPAMTRGKFQSLLARFVASSRDYHASISFFSTESATQPLTILSAGGKYYIAAIDREALPEAKFPFAVGDEVLEFGGQPVAAAAAALVKAPNTAETDARESEILLTRRARRMGMDVPQGPLALKIRTASGEVRDSSLAWSYKPEIVPTDVPVREGGLGAESASPDMPEITVPGDGQDSARRRAVREAIRRLVPLMARPGSPRTGDDAREAAAAGEPFMIGGKKSFVPALGKLVWTLPPQVADKVPFTASIYKDAQGRRIGYLRVPDYMGDENLAQVFAQLIGLFEQKTDVLVYDQVNNPGGRIDYMDAILSMLTGKTLVVPQHRLLIDESDAALAAQIIEQSQQHDLSEMFEEEFADEIGGASFAAKIGGVNQLVAYARFILSELAAGRRLTNPTALFGVAEIAPAEAHYTKPVFVLTNELDFSAADFLAAILQDNAAATIFGVRTAGAGGAVKSVELPNQMGVEQVSYTWTIAQRRGGDPIENLGVTPDVPYQLTAEDLRGGMTGYQKALLDAIAARVPAPAPASAGPGPAPKGGATIKKRAKPKTPPPAK